TEQRLGDKPLHRVARKRVSNGTPVETSAVERVVLNALGPRTRWRPNQQPTLRTPRPRESPGGAAFALCKAREPAAFVAHASLGFGPARLRGGRSERRAAGPAAARRRVQR